MFIRAIPGGPKPIWVLVALITVQILFGLNYVISKVVVENFPPLVWASFRIIVAALILVTVALVLKRPFPQGGRKFFVPLILFSLLGTIINQICFLKGLSLTTSTNAAILNTLIPIFTLMIVTVRGQEPLTFWRALGFASALGGVLSLRGVENFTLSDQTVVGDLLQMINCLSYALFLSYSKEFLEKNDRLWTTALMFCYGSVGITVIAWPDWQNFSMPILSQELLLCAAFAIVGGTLLTYFLNNWALAFAKSSHVALFIYIQPAIAAVLAWLWKDQPITFRMVMATVFIFIGVALGLTSAKPKLTPILADSQS